LVRRLRCDRLYAGAGLESTIADVCVKKQIASKLKGVVREGKYAIHRGRTDVSTSAVNFFGLHAAVYEPEGVLMRE